MYIFEGSLRGALSKYKISNEDRIRYQLHKQKLSVSELFAVRDAEGLDKKEEDIRLYKSEENRLDREAEIAKYSRYMTKMPHKAYKELCKRLRIEPNIHWLEAEEIMQWKELLEEKEIEFKKRPKGFKERGKTKKIDQTKPSKELITKRQKVAEDAARVVKNQADCEEEKIIEEQERLESKEKQEFVEFAMGISNEILAVWHTFHNLFYESFLPELYFIEIYCQLNDFGKKLFREVVELSLEDENAMFEDEYIKQLQCMERGQIKEVVVDSTLLDEIYEFWAFQYDVIDMQPIADITKNLLNYKHEDWKCLVNYHRVLVLKKELLVEGRPFLDYLDKTLLFISNAPCLKVCSTKSNNTNAE